MIRRPWLRHVVLSAGWMLGGAALAPLQLAAQTATVSLAPQVETDPIKCWWRSEATAVIIGEQFGLRLTCGIVETSNVRTVVNREALDPGALSLTPFEVVGGTRHEDIMASPWRYFQYEYRVRLLGNEFFGQDVDIPPVGVTYNLVATATETAEREHTYVLPALPMRIASLVPRKAADIRDGSSDSFAAIEARRFRATSELVGAAVLSGFAVLLLGAALVRTVGRFRGRRTVTARPVAPRAVLGGCVSAIRQLKREVGSEGWTEERIVRVLALLRVAAAVALGRPVAQQTVETGTPSREGQLPLRVGLLRRRRLVVSAPSRATIASAGVAGGVPGRASGGPTIPDALDEALNVFSAARYGRDAQLDAAPLDAALDQAEQEIRRLHLRLLWPRAATAAARSPAGGAVWSR